MKMRILIKAIIIWLFLCPSVFAESQQASGVTAQVVIDRARYYLAGTGDSFWTDATEMLSYVNAGIAEIADTTKCLESTEVETLQTGVTRYAISSTYFSIERAVYSGATTTDDSNNFKGLTRTDIQTIGHGADVGEPVQFYVWDDSFYVDPKPSSAVSGYTVTLYLAERPTDIALTAAVPTPAAYDDALVLFVAFRAAIKDRQWVKAAQLQALYERTVSLHFGRFQAIKGGKP